MAYRVKALLVIAHDTAGKSHHKYEGELLPKNPQTEQLQQMLDDGFVEEIGDDQ
jgi:hypothetical protein